MRRTPAVIGALAVTGLLLVGCGSSDSGSGSDEGDATTTTAAGPMTDAELSALLLTPEELGTGWTVDPSSSGSSQAPSCLQNLGDDGPKSVADAEIQFQNGETVFAAENLGAQASEADAEAAWTKVDRRPRHLLGRELHLERPARDRHHHAQRRGRRG